MVRDINQRGLNSGSALCVARDAVEDLIRGPGPNEGFWALVMHADVLTDGGFQLFDAAESTPSNAFVGEFGEPALHQVDPRTVGGREVDVEARPLGEPFPDHGRLVGAVVVGDQVNLQVRGHLGLDRIQKLAKLLRAMAAVQLADDAVGLQFQCGE
jgi:hypothetical protein